MVYNTNIISYMIFFKKIHSCNFVRTIISDIKFFLRKEDAMAKNNLNKKKELLKPKNDIVFQSLFTKNNEKITKAFVEALIGRKVKNIKINVEKELQREKPEDKLGILDLQLDLDENEKLDVEVQLIEKDNFAERLLYYFSRLYGETVKRSEDYIKAQRVILIAIVDYEVDITKEIEEFETQWKLRETKNPQLVLTDKEEIVILELDKVRKAYEKNKDNKKAQWMLFLDDPNTKEVEEIMKKNKDIEEAVVTVHEMSEDEKLRRLAFLREKAIMDEKAIRRAGYKRGLEAGMKDGMEKRNGKTEWKSGMEKRNGRRKEKRKINYCKKS